MHYFEIITQEINRKNGKQFVVLFWKLHCHLDIRCYALFAYSWVELTFWLLELKLQQKSRVFLRRSWCVVQDWLQFLKGGEQIFFFFFLFLINFLINSLIIVIYIFNQIVYLKFITIITIILYILYMTHMLSTVSMLDSTAISNNFSFWKHTLEMQ